jgi:hypothetical protein
MGREQHVHNKKKAISLNLPPSLLFLLTDDLHIDTFFKKTTLGVIKKTLPTQKKKISFLNFFESKQIYTYIYKEGYHQFSYSLTKYIYYSVYLHI